MNKKQMKMLLRIITTTLLMIILQIVPSDGYIRFGLYMIPYLIIGYDILYDAVFGICQKQIFDENFLMAVATIGAIIIGVSGNGDYIEAVAVMLFYQIGELFQSYAVGKSRRNISELMDIRPEYAGVETNEGIVNLDPDEVEPGSVIVVKPGEKIPIDGVIIEGKSLIDTSALTGESLPKEVEEGMEVISGCINLSGVIRLHTTKKFGESAVAKILELVENASFNKAKSEDFISKFARIYTPVVCISAFVLAILPPLVIGLLSGEYGWNIWLYRALTFLVVSCPCALVISIPLAFFAGIGGASRAGVLIKGSNYIETLSKVSAVAFDKTGTLTKGVFEVTDVYCNDIDRDILMEYAAYAESMSLHPISRSICCEYGKEIEQSRVKNIQEISGRGVSAEIDGKSVFVGNAKLMREINVQFAECSDTGTVIYVAIDNCYAGYILISDKIKNNSLKAIRELKKSGIKKTVMLTGDNKIIASEIASELGVDEFYSELLPQDKVEKAEELIKLNVDGYFAFVGDGINDAPVLTRADVGIAMGGIGSDAAIEAADVVLMDDDPMKLVKAIKISKKCIRIVYQNCIFAIGIKLICLGLAAFGIANMWLAIFADVGVMVIAVVNAMRAL